MTDDTTVSLTAAQREKLDAVAEHYYPTDDPPRGDVVELLADMALDPGFGPDPTRLDET